MYDAISCKSLYQKANVFRHKKTYYPNRVDNAQGESEISNLFADKFQNLYNCVSYKKKKEDMDALLNDINGLVITKCKCFGQCMHDTHSIIVAEVGSAIEKLKPGQMDGSTEVVSDHIINACERLNVHIAILFKMILMHGLSPDGKLHGTMVPISKGRWANLSSSNKFRAITLSSIL